MIEEYRQLLEMTQSYLLQSCKNRKSLFVDGESYSYFSKRPLPQKKPQPPPPPAPVVKKSTPAPPKPQVEEKKEPEKPPEKEKKEIVLQPVKPAEEEELSDIRKLVKKLAPNLKLHEKPPEAVKKGTAVAILSFGEEGEELAFLQSVARAASEKLAPAKIYRAQTVEKRGGWEEFFKNPSLKVVIAAKEGLKQAPGLQMLYCRSPEGNGRLLDKTPFLPLGDISGLAKEKKAKAALWEALKRALS